jgi:hypothetical protein
MVEWDRGFRIELRVAGLVAAICALAIASTGCGGGGQDRAKGELGTPAASSTLTPPSSESPAHTPLVTSTSSLTPATVASAAPATAPPAARIEVNGSPYFLYGANFPWISYGNDIGSNAFGSYGYHTGGAYDTEFAGMAAEGIHVVRLVAFADGRAIEFDESGTPVGVSPDTFADLDALMALARKNNLYLNIVLLDFSFFNYASFSGEVQQGGHTDVFTDPAKRAALIDNVIGPVVTRYSAEPHVLSWELMNEPEWAISDLPQAAVNDAVQPVTMKQFWAYGASVAQLAHAAGGRVTVGSACLKWNAVWTPAFAAKKGLPSLALDYYQTHYYGWMDGNATDAPDLGKTTWSPLTQRVSDLALDKPIVIGEITDDEASRDAAWENGYAGYWAWSYEAETTYDHFALAPGFGAWGAAHDATLIAPP